jgi:DUF1009 family protein
LKLREPIGLVAGAGGLPIHFAHQARKNGYPLFLFALRGAADGSLPPLAEATCWASVGQVGSLIAFFKKRKVKKIVFHGKVQHGSFFRNVRFDWRGLSLWAQTKDKSGPGLLKVLGLALKKEGLQVLDGRFLMDKLMVPRGCLTRKRPLPEILRQVSTGIRQARELARLGIGQSLVLQAGAIAAVEAMEGTDETIRRAGRWAGKGTILVKVAGPNQDWRFDVPTIGYQTIQTLAKLGAAGMVLEAGKVFLLEREKTLQMADLKKLFIYAL